MDLIISCSNCCPDLAVVLALLPATQRELEGCPVVDPMWQSSGGSLACLAVCATVPMRSTHPVGTLLVC